MWIKSVFLRALSALVTVFMLLPLGRGVGEPYDVKEPDACVAHFSVLSDSHIEGNNYVRYTVFARALQDVKRCRSGSDAVVFLGDNTMNGFFGEHLLFHGAVAAKLRHETVLPVMGNHDIGNGQGDYEKLQNRWYAFTEAFFGLKLEHPYYYSVIGGAYYIVLGLEAHESNRIVMRDAQFTWLEDVLRQAADSGMPAFVFAHHPTQTATNENGERTDRLINMLADFNREHDLFCFVGHTHRTLHLSSSFRTNNGYPEIFLPCLTSLTGEKDRTTHENTGVGVDVEVYENEVVVRGRDFYRSEWKFDVANGTACEMTYTLKNPISVS